MRLIALMLAVAFTLMPLAAKAQQPRVARIGVLGQGSPPPPPGLFTPALIVDLSI
jgi:hypothetical protein